MHSMPIPLPKTPDFRPESHYFVEKATFQNPEPSPLEPDLTPSLATANLSAVLKKATIMRVHCLPT